MAYEKVKRNRYYDPPNEYPHSSIHHYQDLQELEAPIVRMHHSNLHDWGIARGLEVTGTLGGAEVVINPGVAIDGSGQLVSLSSAGHGDIGTNPPGGQNTEVQVPVHLGIGSHAGKTVYVTIQFSEILRPAEGSGGRMEQVPWIRLQPTAGAGAYVDNGASIILAIAVVNAGGNLAELKEKDPTLSYRRRLIGETIEELRIRRSNKTGNSVQEAISGKVRPGEGGGLQITVPNTGDAISFTKEGGGTFAKMSIATEQIVARRSDGKESVVIDTQLGNITAGTQGVEGDIMVRDASNRLVIALDGNDAAITVGASGNEGDIIVKDNAGQDAVRVDGNTGNISTKRITPTAGTTGVLDVDTRYFRVHGWDLCLDGRSGGNKRALVDSSNKLIINFANDYANGVDINRLHLSDHIKTGFWEEGSEWNPGRYQWHTFYEKDIGLKWSEWFFVTMCEIGMFDHGTVNEFWWQTDNASYQNSNGNIVIKWNIEYGDRGTDWLPWYRAVCWIAFRK